VSTPIDPAIVDRLEALGIMRDRYKLQPLNRLQKFIAQRLTEASRDIPTFPLEMNIELDALLAARTEYNAKGGAKVSVNDLLIKASALTLKKIAQVNVSFTPDGIVQHDFADVAVAVATDIGLMTPIIRGAEAKTVAQISEEMKDLAARARTMKLKPDEYTGGSFSVSNLGMYGISRFGSIINPPHAAILSVGAGEERVIVKNKQPAVATMISAVLTCDHRVVDGANGAKWLKAFRDLIEAPAPLFA
jgi:pyruvate dehydrogenase E2 component (dihydrolipoamide acetyltransferase)